MVGLEETSKRVLESVGRVEACITVHSHNTSSCAIEFPFVLRLSTSDDSAGKRNIKDNFKKWYIQTQSVCVFDHVWV